MHFCVALKPQFAANMEIQKLSQHFVMVNIQDDEDPKDSKFAPDGGYIPRIIFLGKSRTIQALRDASLQYNSLVYCEMHPFNTIV